MNICFYTDCGKLTCNQNHTAVMFVNLMSKLNSPAVNDDSVSTEPKIKPLQQLFPLISILSILNDSLWTLFFTATVGWNYSFHTTTSFPNLSWGHTASEAFNPHAKWVLNFYFLQFFWIMNLIFCIKLLCVKHFHSGVFCKTPKYSSPASPRNGSAELGHQGVKLNSHKRKRSREQEKGQVKENKPLFSAEQTQRGS